MAFVVVFEAFQTLFWQVGDANDASFLDGWWCKWCKWCKVCGCDVQVMLWSCQGGSDVASWGMGFVSLLQCRCCLRACNKKMGPSLLLAEAAPSSGTNTLIHWAASTTWAMCSKCRGNCPRRNRCTANAWRSARELSGGSELQLASRNMSPWHFASWMAIIKSEKFDLRGGLGVPSTYRAWCMLNLFRSACLENGNYGVEFFRAKKKGQCINTSTHTHSHTGWFFWRIKLECFWDLVLRGHVVYGAAGISESYFLCFTDLLRTALSLYHLGVCLRVFPKF